MNLLFIKHNVWISFSVPILDVIIYYFIIKKCKISFLSNIVTSLKESSLVTLNIVWLGTAELAELLADGRDEGHGRVGGAEGGVAQDPGGLQTGFVEGPGAERTRWGPSRRGCGCGTSPGSSWGTVTHTSCRRPSRVSRLGPKNYLRR